MKRILLICTILSLPLAAQQWSPAPTSGYSALNTFLGSLGADHVTTTDPVNGSTACTVGKDMWTNSTTGDRFYCDNTSTSHWIKMARTTGLTNCAVVSYSTSGPTWGCTTDVVRTSAASTLGAFLYDYSASTLKVPAGAGFTASAVSNLGYDTTATNVHVWNGADAILSPFASLPTTGHCVQVAVVSSKLTLVDSGSSNCGGGGSVAWSGISNPSGNLALTMAGNTTTLTWGATTGSGVDLFKLTDTTGNTGTGSIVNINTASGSAAKPLTAASNGNGVAVDSTGVLGKVGTGHVNADQVNGASVPASQTCLGSNGSSQLITGTCGGGSGTQMAFHFEGSGSALATTLTSCSTELVSGTIAGWYVEGDVSGSATFGVKKIAFGSYTGTAGYSGYTDVVNGGTAPSITTAASNSSTTLTSWLTSWTGGDILCVQMSSPASFTWVNLHLKVN